MSDRIAPEDFRSRIYFIRGRHVMLQADVARVYELPATRLLTLTSEFPGEFCFTLEAWELPAFAVEIGEREVPRAFTEHGALALACAIGTREALAASLRVVRAFTTLRTDQPGFLTPAAAAVTPPTPRSNKPRRGSPSSARVAGARAQVR